MFLSTKFYALINYFKVFKNVPLRIMWLSLPLLVLTSCDNFLDTYPKDGVGSAQMWQTAEHAEKGLIAIYSSIRDRGTFNAPFYDAFTDMAFLTDNHGTTFDEWNAYKLCINSATSQETLFSFKWQRLYRAIAKCNDAIAYVPDIQMDTLRRSELLAEAKFLRALYYFDLLDFYSGHDTKDLGIPLYTERAHYEEAYFPRSKPAEVRRLLIQDLTEAIPDLPFHSTARGRANQAAARMLLGKVYLYAKDFDKASKIFGGLIQDNLSSNIPYALYNDYYNLFQLKGSNDLNNKEFIFLVNNLDLQDYGTVMNMIYGNRSCLGPGDIVSVGDPVFIDTYQLKDTGEKFDWAVYGIDLSLSENALRNSQNAFWNDKSEVNRMFNTRDPRLDATFIRPWSTYVGFKNGEGDVTYEYRPSTFSGSSSFPRFLTDARSRDVYAWRKFVPTSNQCPIRRNSPIDIPIMRYADLLLLFAEAKNEVEGPVDSVYWAVNQVRQRPSVDMPSLDLGLNQEEMRKAIRAERGWELAGEGFRYSDYRRWYKYDSHYDISVMNYDITGFNRANRLSTRVFTERCWQYAVPQSDIEMNPYLRQNSGWEF